MKRAFQLEVLQIKNLEEVEILVDLVEEFGQSTQ